MVTLYLLLAGKTAIEPLVGMFSILFYAGMLLFAVIAWPVIRKT